MHEDGSAFPGDTHPSIVALETGSSVRDVVMGVLKPDGTLTWILVNAEIFSDPRVSMPTVSSRPSPLSTSRSRCADASPSWLDAIR